MYTVYIIQSEVSGKYYVGCTNDLGRRLREHVGGKSKYTRSDTHWKLKYKEEYPELSLARKRERQIKSWKSRKAIERLIHGPIV